MKSDPLSWTKILVLFVLAWVAVIAIYSPAEINAQFVREFEFCGANRVGRVLRWKESIGGIVESVRGWVFWLLYEVTSFGIAEDGFERVHFALFDPDVWDRGFEALHTLVLLIAVRVGAMVGFLKVLLVLMVAGFVDALAQRKIASVSFHAAMPLVSFWALLGVKGLPLLAFVCLMIPASGMPLVAVGLLTGAMVAMAVGLRHFHRFER